MAFLRDITDRKRAEETLQHSETRFRELISNMSNAVAIYQAVEDGEDFIFLDVNPAWRRLSRSARET